MSQQPYGYPPQHAQQPQYGANPPPQYAQQGGPPPGQNPQWQQQHQQGPPPGAYPAQQPQYGQQGGPAGYQQSAPAPLGAPPPQQQQPHNPHGYNPILMKQNRPNTHSVGPNQAPPPQAQHHPQQAPSQPAPAPVAGGGPGYGAGKNPQGYGLEAHLARPKWAANLPSVARFDHQQVMDRMITEAGDEDAQDKVRAMIEEAQNEHVKKAIPFNADEDTMKKEFGPGCVYFFDFIKFLTLSNIVLIILQGINYTLFAVDEEPQFVNSNNTAYGSREGYHDFFITAYQPKHAAGWYALNVISLIFCLIAAPMYYKIMKRKNLPEDQEDESNQSIFDTDERMLRYNNDCTIDVGYYYRSNGDLFARRFVSAFVFAVLIGVQIFASYMITRQEDSSSDLGQAFGIAILVSVLNIIYTFVAKLMTEFEKWSLFGRWKRSLTLKLIFFKLANIVTVYAAKDYKNASAGKCVYDVIGEQFLTLLIVETFVMNIWELVATLLHARFYLTYTKIMASITGDKDNLPQFDLALEYLEVVYRQYLCILSMVVFPLSVGFATIGFLIEFMVDKIRLYKICGKPRVMVHSQKEFLSFNLILIAIVGFFTPYAGTLYVMAGWTKDVSALCSFP